MIKIEKCHITGICKKQVINVCNGTFIGYVTDIEFDSCDGKVTAFIVGDCTALGFPKGESIRIPFCKVQCFGEEMILAEIVTEECRYAPEDSEKKRKKGFLK